jgi:hypothetical protein
MKHVSQTPGLYRKIKQWRYVDAGAAQEVWRPKTTKSAIVAKVLYNGRNSPGAMYACLRWALLCKRLWRKCIYLPRVYAVCYDPTEDVYITFCERLNDSPKYTGDPNIWGTSRPTAEEQARCAIMRVFTERCERRTTAIQGLEWDLHSFNVMYRGAVPVVNDPWHSWDDNFHPRIH